MMIEQLGHRKPFNVDMKSPQPQILNRKPIIIVGSDPKTTTNNKKSRGRKNGLPENSHDASRGHKQILPGYMDGETTHALLADNLPDIQVEVAPPILEPSDDFGWADFPLLSPILVDDAFLPFDDSPEVSVAQEGG